MARNSNFVQKWKTYTLTFCTYMAMHIMRMTYSHIVPQFKQVFHLTNLYLGIFDALIYLALSLGFFLRFVLQDTKHMLRSFFVCISLACLGYLFIPISSLLLGSNLNSYFFFQNFLPSIGLLFFGFFQFASWSTVMVLISQHFDIKSEGTALGVWSANGDVGNILGFALTGIMIDNLSLKWETAMIVASVIAWIIALLVYLFVGKKQPQVSNHLIEEEAQMIHCQKEEQSQHQKFLGFIREAFQTKEITIYLVALGTLKSIVYGFYLWMPTFLTHNHLAAYKSIIPIIFGVGTLMGSFILGTFYEEQKSEDQQEQSNNCKRHVRLYALFYACLGMVASLLFFYLVKNNLTVYFLCSFVSGAFLGGCFNMLAGNEVFSMTRGSQQSLSFLSTLSMVCGNFCVGIVEIVIGVVLDMKNDPQGEHKLFVILIAVGCLGMLVMFWRSRLQQEKHYAEVEQTESKTIKQ